MGTLEIRRASAQLNNLGTIHTPDLDTGASRAYEARARAALAAADAARVAGRAAVENISKRGELLAKGLSTVGETLLSIYDDISEKQANDALIEYERQRQEYLGGDGTENNPGKLNENFSSAEQWLSDIDKENARRTASVTENLTPHARRMFEKKIAARDLEWNYKVRNQAGKRTLETMTASARQATDLAQNEAIANFSDPQLRDESIQRYYDSVGKEMDVIRLPQELRPLEYKKRTEAFLTELAKAKFTEWGNQTRNNTDPEAVETFWSEKQKELEALNGRTPTNGLIRKHLGSDAIGKLQHETLSRMFLDAKASAINGAHQARNRLNAETARTTTQAELNALRNPVPKDEKGQKAYYDGLAADYRRFSEVNDLSPEKRLSYVHTAMRLEEHARTIGKSKPNAHGEMYESAKSQVTLGGHFATPGDAASFTPDTPDKIVADIDAYLNAGQLTPEDWWELASKAKGKQLAKRDEEDDAASEALLKRVFREYGDLVPKSVLYDKERNAFQMSDTARKGGRKNADLLKSSDETTKKLRLYYGTEGDSETATYQDLLHAFEYVRNKRNRRNGTMTEDEQFEEFKRLFSPTVASQRAKNMADAQTMLREAVRDWAK